MPGIPHDRIAYVDGYGNLKTTIGAGSVTAGPGSRVRLRVGEAEQTATVSDGSVAVEQGQLAFAPGSSGWEGGEGGVIRWMELFLRGGNAWEAFGRPAVGERIRIVGL